MKNPFKKKDQPSAPAGGSGSYEKKADDDSWADADSPYADIFKEPKKGKIKKKWLIFIAIAALLVVIFLSLQFCNRQTDEAMTDTDFVKLSPSEFMSTVEVSGNVSAEHDIDAYTDQMAPVKSLLVEEGDTVEQGQVIARLDDKKVRQQLRAREAAYGMTAERAQAEVQTAKNRYYAAANALNQGVNSAITAAEASLISAQQGLKDATAAYENYKSDLAEGFDPQIMGNESLQSQAELGLKQAQLNYDQALDEYNRNEQDYVNYGDDMDDYDRDREMARRALSDLQWEMNDLEMRLKDPTYQPTEQELRRFNDLPVDISNATYRLQDAEAEYQSAKMNRETAEKTRDAKRYAVSQARLAVETAEDNLRTANRNVDADSKHAQDRLDQLKRAQDAAEASVKSAEATLASAKHGAKTELQAYEDALRTAQVAGKDPAGAVELANLKEMLDDHVVRAPISGTITKLYVDVGQTANGPIAKLEDLDTYIAEAELKELDVVWVKRGMRVELTNDAFSDETFDGTVVFVSRVASSGDASFDPAAAAGAGALGAAGGGGSSSGNTKPTYKVKVAVKDPAHKLYAGMRMQMKIILAEDQGVYGVPQTAVYENDAGQEVVLVAKPTGKKEQYELKEVPVTTSLDNDVSVVIEGKDLKDNMRIVSMPEKEQVGKVVKVPPKKAGEKEEKEPNPSLFNVILPLAQVGMYDG